MLRAIVWFSALVLLGAGWQQGNAQEKALAKEVRKMGFTPVYPLRAGFVPGQLFRHIRDTQGRQQVEVLCENLFADQPNALRSNDWILSTRSYKDKFTLGAVLSLLAGALTNFADASAEAKAAFEWNRALELSLKGVKHNYVPVEARFSKGDAEFTLEAPCKAALNSHKLKDPKLKNLFIVAETLTGTEVSVSIDRKVAASLEVDAKLNTLVAVKPSTTLSFDHSGDLITGALATPIAFAYFAVPIKSYGLPPGTTAAGNALLSVELPE